MKRFQGIAAAPGYAIGPALHFRRRDMGVRRREITDTVTELKRLEEAQAAASEQVQRIKEKAERELAPEQAAIFQAQLLMLQDPELLRDIRTAIETEHVNAEWAVNAAITRYAHALDLMDNAYF